MMRELTSPGLFCQLLEQPDCAGETVVSAQRASAGRRYQLVIL